MSFAVFILYLILTFARPGEQIAALRAWPVMDVTSGLALGFAVLAVLLGHGPTLRSMQIPIMAALWAWALVSFVGNSDRPQAAFQMVIDFGKSGGVMLLLAVLNVVSLRRMRVVAGFLTILGLLLALQAAAGHHVNLGSAPVGTMASGSAGAEWRGGADLGSPPGGALVARSRGVGIFGDPNDLAVTLLSMLPLCLALRRRAAPFGNALMVWVPFALMVYAIYLTRSRGGVVALACVLALSFRHRVGTVLSVLAAGGALMVLIAMGFTGGRSMELDQSAMGRVHAWSDGLQMLKSSPLWGVGLGRFVEHHPRAAHSSFVMCFAELGFVGYSLWLALILLTLDDLRRLSQLDGGDHSGAEFRRWALAVLHGLLGALVGGLFLSRSYDVTLFMLLGLGTALGDVARRQGHLTEVRSPIRTTLLVAGTASASIVAYWLYMRLFR